VQNIPAAERPQVRTALIDASVHAFRIGMVISAALAMLGGVIALLGIENPRRRVRSVDCPGGAMAPPAKAGSAEPAKAGSPA
jgi:hypothetical protein